MKTATGLQFLTLPRVVRTVLFVVVLLLVAAIAGRAFTPTRRDTVPTQGSDRAQPPGLPNHALEPLA